MRINGLLIFLFISCFGVACQSRQNKPETATSEPVKKAQQIIDKAIAEHGGKKFEHLQVAFDFRDRHYEATRQGGVYTYTRSFTDSTGQVKDVLTNNSFTRTINGQKQNLPEERVKAFTASVNSVIYFALLPYGLNDPAVKKEWIGTATIKNKPYAKIKVSFAQEGGGADFQDEFLYFINQQTNTLDYFAYTYATEGGGIRFREAVNARVIQGIRFQDYINYEPTDSTDFWQIEKLIDAKKLKEFSRIALKHITVQEP